MTGLGAGGEGAATWREVTFKPRHSCDEGGSIGVFTKPTGLISNSPVLSGADTASESAAGEEKREHPSAEPPNELLKLL